MDRSVRVCAELHAPAQTRNGLRFVKLRVAIKAPSPRKAGLLRYRKLEFECAPGRVATIELRNSKINSFISAMLRF